MRKIPAWRPAAAWTVAMVQIVLAVLPALTPTPAAAQTGGSTVDKGREYYEQSRFDEAVALLQDLVDRGALSGADLQKARELLARSLVKKGYPVRARGLFRDILAQDPAWRPDPIRVPPDEAAVFEQALAEFSASRTARAPADSAAVTPAAPAPGVAPPAPPPPAPAATPPPARPVPAATIVPAEKKSNKTWLWIAGGVAAAGIIAAVAAGGGGGGGDAPPANPLPAFPAPPTP